VTKPGGRLPRGWNGKPVTRWGARVDKAPLATCPVCGKNLFKTRDDARAQLAAGGRRMRAYKACVPGFFHSTSADAATTQAYRAQGPGSRQDEDDGT
jgi:hypothetical protein